MSDRRQQKELIAVRVTDKFKKDMEKIAEEKGMTLTRLSQIYINNYKDRIHEETRDKLSEQGGLVWQSEIN